MYKNNEIHFCCCTSFRYLPCRRMIVENFIMKYDPSVLTFRPNFAIQKNDHVARIPAGIATKDDLCAAIQEQLTVPAYFTTGNWDHLHDVLRFPNFELSA